MRRLIRPSFGLLGRVFAIVLLTVVIEFGASTLLYERTSRLSAREDEARRVAEHLVISRRLLAEQPVDERATTSAQLTTDRYTIRWRPAPPATPPVAPALDEMRAQIIAWEPSLARTELRLRLRSPGRTNVVMGGLRLPDGTWLDFSTAELLDGSELAVNRIVLALVPAIALILIGGALLRVTLRPLRQLVRAADAIGHGSTAPLVESGPSEVRRVIHAFNEMQGRILQLIADRTQALAAVSHDLRTPIARLRLRADALRDDEARHALGGDLEEIDAMIASLLAYFGGENDPETPTRLDLAVLVATLVDEAADRGRDVRYDGPDHLDATLRPSEIRRAIANLIDNALHYGETVAVSLVASAEDILLAVEDDGPGIPPDKLEAVLRPFERLDPARGRNTEGLGLGLAIVVRAVAREGGALRLHNRPEGGLRAEIALPRATSNI